jgi:hypothetical protein
MCTQRLSAALHGHCTHTHTLTRAQVTTAISQRPRTQVTGSRYKSRDSEASGRRQPLQLRHQTENNNKATSPRRGTRTAKAGQKPSSRSSSSSVIAASKLSTRDSRDPGSTAGMFFLCSGQETPRSSGDKQHLLTAFLKVTFLPWVRRAV